MATTKKMTLLNAVEQIVDKANGSALSGEFYRKAAKPINYISKKMGITREQSVMLALLIERCGMNDETSLGELGELLECRNVVLLRHINDFEELERRRFIACRRRNSYLAFRVPSEVVKAFSDDVSFKPRDLGHMDCAELFVEVEQIFTLRESDYLTFEGAVQRVNELFDSNRELEFVRKVRAMKLGDEDMMLLVMFCHLFVNNGDDHICHHDLDSLYDRRSTWARVKNRLSTGRHPFFVHKLIEFNNSDGFEDRSSMRVTMSAKRELLGELNLVARQQDRNSGDMLRAAEIEPKELFYGDRVAERVDELGSLLDQDRYNDVRSRLKKSGFRYGFACLFYGAPGTGKTETVLQLARRTGRDILQVNISQIKSMWVGESEKNIKQVFDRYRAIVKERDVAPILLFNEADAVIGIRQEGAQRAVDKMENAIQNIILQEMEDLDGILIATTNLVQNLDKAFERRFLYKIKFDMPTAEARASIWRTMIPALDEAQALSLADRYDFSGGQIENIARHYAIGTILHGTPEDVVETIAGYCDGERLESTRLNVGFN